MFIPRLTAPPNTNVHWIKAGFGGLNPCILGSPSYGPGSVLANCVGYAYGRAWEILNRDPGLSINSASDWYGHTQDGYPRSQTPALGAIACWDDGASGHVAVIEEIQYNNGQIVSCTISESVYGGTFFRTWTISPPTWYRFTGYTFQGFIILPVDTDLDMDTLAAIIKKQRKLKVIVK